MPLPSFIIGGVRRGGTTSLYHAIKQHPDIFLHPHSELNYFIEEEVSGRAWCGRPVDPQRWEATHSVADYAALFAGGEGAAAAGHKGADLLFWHPAHARMARFVPEARFVFSLRHPVKRAWSHYWAECAKGRETLGFEQALAAEEKRAQANDWARYHLSYRRRGFYDTDLLKFFEVFPRERVLVLTLEETMADPSGTLQRVYRFLGVDPEKGLGQAGTRRQKGWATLPRPWTRRPGLHRLAAGYEKSTESLANRIAWSKDSRRALRNFLQKPTRRTVSDLVIPAHLFAELDSAYEPHIRALEKLLGRPFDEWRRREE